MSTSKRDAKIETPNADIWHVALHWHKIKPQIIHHLKQGTYQFDLVKTHQLQNKKIIALWTTPDAIVLKAFAIALTQAITKNNQMQSVKHLKGNGGLKAAVREAYEKSQNPQHYIFKTDIKSYYQTINHKVLLQQLKTYTQDPGLHTLLKNYCQRVNIIQGKCQHTTTKSIPQGCSLAPVLGAIYLNKIDIQAQKAKIHTIRFMHDILFISERRWPLKRFVKKIYQQLSTLQQTLRQEKTWMSRIAKGFTYCGLLYPTTHHCHCKHHEKKFIHHKKKLLKKTPNLLNQYIQRWYIWIKSGIILQSKIIQTIGYQCSPS